MKLSKLFKLILKEYGRDLIRSILLFVLIDFIYANFTGIRLNGEISGILWQGGMIYLLGVKHRFIKAFEYLNCVGHSGKIADKLSDDIMIYILARITDYSKFICAYSNRCNCVGGNTSLCLPHSILLCCGILLRASRNESSLFVDGCLGFFGIMLLYIV